MIKIMAHAGMVNIDNEKIAYSNIRCMYEGNRNGAGLQLDGEQYNKSDEINECCGLIATYIYKLQDLLTPNAMLSGKPPHDEL